MPGCLWTAACQFANRGRRALKGYVTRAAFGPLSAHTFASEMEVRQNSHGSVEVNFNFPDQCNDYARIHGKSDLMAPGIR